MAAAPFSRDIRTFQVNLILGPKQFFRLNRCFRVIRFALTVLNIMVKRSSPTGPREYFVLTDFSCYEFLY
jgi:hypothetical protein